MMFCEPIEPRRLLAGNVSVVLRGESIAFIGDAAANALSVVRSRDTGDFVVTGLNGTTVDGRAARTYPGRSNVTADLVGGDDTVTFDRLSGSANLSVRLGTGNDTVYVKRGLLGAADLYGDTGSDTLDVTGTTFAKRLRVFAGEQDDTTGIRDVRARRGLEVTDTAGNSTVAMKQVSAGDESYVSGSSRRDTFTIVDSDFAAFSAKLKAGNDTAFIRGTTFARSSPVDGGTGTNDINREVIVNSDFASGNLDGWYLQPSGSYPTFGDTSVGEEEFRFKNSGTFGFAPITPPSLGLTGSVFRVNHVGDAILVRNIGLEDGIQPGRPYIVRVSAKLIVGGDGINGVISIGAVGHSSERLKVGLDSYRENVLVDGGPAGSLVRREGVVSINRAADGGGLKAFVDSYYGEFTGTEVDFRSVQVTVTPL